VDKLKRSNEYYEKYCETYPELEDFYSDHYEFESELKVFQTSIDGLLMK
jgi:hypothetical protein